MSKLSRTVLKEIVKECIIEIFEESFFTQASLVSEGRKNNNRKRRARPVTTNPRSNHLNNITYEKNNSLNNAVTHNTTFNSKINEITSNLTSDPIMADIFKDTASTTLQKQNNSNGRNGMVVTGGDEASMTVSNSDPTELFAESAGKWATLAFAEQIKR